MGKLRILFSWDNASLDGFSPNVLCCIWPTFPCHVAHIPVLCYPHSCAVLLTFPCCVTHIPILCYPYSHAVYLQVCRMHLLKKRHAAWSCHIAFLSCQPQWERESFLMTTPNVCLLPDQGTVYMYRDCCCSYCSQQHSQDISNGGTLWRAHVRYSNSSYVAICYKLPEYMNSECTTLMLILFGLAELSPHSAALASSGCALPLTQSWVMTTCNSQWNRC